MRRPLPLMLIFGPNHFTNQQIWQLADWKGQMAAKNDDRLPLMLIPDSRIMRSHTEIVSKGLSEQRVSAMALGRGASLRSLRGA